MYNEQNGIMNSGFRLKGATEPSAHLEKSSLNFSCSWFAIRVNLLHP